MTEVETGKSAEAEGRIIALVKERADGGPSRLGEALEIARSAGIGDGWVRKRFEEAEQALNEATEVWIRGDEEGEDPVVASRAKRAKQTEAEASFKKPEVQPSVEKRPGLDPSTIKIPA